MSDLLPFCPFLVVVAFFATLIVDRTRGVEAGLRAGALLVFFVSLMSQKHGILAV